MDFLDSIKLYFFTLGEEISELLSNIWKALKTKKRITIVSGIILFILGCLIWKPLCSLTITGLFLLCATFCVMLIPIILTASVFCYMSFYFLPKYPVLNETVTIICSIAVFVFTTYLAYDFAIRDLWYQPELWSEILKLK